MPEFIPVMMHIKRFDLNSDGFIDLSELMEVSGAFGVCEGDEKYEERLDFNGDGCIDITEITLLAQLFGAEVPK